MACGQAGKRLFAKALVIGRVEKDEIERPVEASRFQAQIGRVAAMDAGVSEEAQRFNVVTDRPARGGIGLDEKRKRRPARHGFQPERAGARKKVEHAPAAQSGAPRRMRQNVEHRLARAIARGPCIPTRRRCDGAAFEFSPDNAHASAHATGR